jgi:hypothetical protein
MRACKALVFILRQAASRRAVVVAFEREIVAEKENDGPAQEDQAARHQNVR